jgi:hypothetical protein
MAATSRYVAIYTRISKGKYGNAETCLDQEALGRAYAERTWPGMPVRVFSDPDLSAMRKPGSRRCWPRRRSAG